MDKDKMLSSNRPTKQSIKNWDMTTRIHGMLRWVSKNSALKKTKTYVQLVKMQRYTKLVKKCKPIAE
jgi:hypothetical protein